MASPPSTSSAQHRKALLQQYKQAPPPAGVYAIRNREHGRVYVGAGLNVQGAMNRARFELQRGAHRNAVLQRDWHALGADAFGFEVLGTVKRRDDGLPQDIAGELQDLLALWREEAGHEWPARLRQ